MRDVKALKELITKAQIALRDVRVEADALVWPASGYDRDPALVQAEAESLRERLARAEELAHRLRQTRTEVRSVLGAKLGERTTDAAKRAVEARANFSEVRIRTILGAKLSETTEQAASRAMKPTLRLQKAVDNLRRARAEVREILGAQPGEGSRAAARRVVSQLEKQPIYPKTNSDRSTVFHVYNQLDETAQRAGYPPGSVGAYVHGLAIGKKTYAE